jgi:VWFA-related protein
MYRLILIFSFIVSLTALLFGQTALEAPKPPTDRRITLDVQVADKSGNPIRGLQAQDFTILDDKESRKIASFQTVDTSSSDLPVEIVLVMDAVNTPLTSLAYERDEAKKFLLKNGGKLGLPVSIIFFTDHGTNTGAPSRDGNALAKELDQYEIGLRTSTRSQGFYGASDRYGLSMQALDAMIAYEQNRPGRKLMIWFSDGWALLSGVNVQPSQKEEQAIFVRIIAASTRLRDARITLYQIAPYGAAAAGSLRSAYYEEFLKGVKSSNQAVYGNLALPVLAIQSGGRVFNTTNDLTGALASCASDADYFYVIGFDSFPADDPDEYHALQVKVDKSGVKARTRTGYYNQK